jgi:carbamoyl-phosphate synthase large subunit
MKTLLITAIAGDIAQGIARIIREVFPDWQLIGMDVHTRHGGEHFVDKLFTAPLASDFRYDEWLEELIDQNRIDICIPMSEAELLHLIQTRKKKVSGAKFVMPNFKAIEIGCDKLETSHFLETIGCEGPWTIPTEEFSESTPLPCIIKPRRSAGSKSVHICNSISDLDFYRKKNPASILQELLLPADKEVTCAVFRDRNGRTAVLQLLRTLVDSATGWAKVVDFPEITRQCRQLAEGLELRGSINVQLRVTDNGPRIFEINPRFSSTVLMRHKMGFKDVFWSLQEALGETVEFFSPEVGTTAARVQDAVLLKKSIEDFFSR